MPSQIVKSTIQAGALSAASNFLAQAITAWRAGTPIDLNMTALLQFVIFSVVTCPPNCIWQGWLEAQFPAYADELPAVEKETLVEDVATGHGTGKQADDGTAHRRHVGQKAMTEDSPKAGSKNAAGRLNVRNTAIKFALDQTLGAAVNTVLFIAGIALLRGQTTVYQNIQDQFWPMIFAGQKLWPAVSILSFTVIPLEQRMLFGSVAGLFWGVYLSLAAGSG